MLTLQNVIDSIKEPDQEAADLARRRWDSVAKPLNSLGALERDLVRIAGVQGTPRISIGSKAIVVMCADNGIVEEGVTQTGQEVTAIVAEHMGDGTSCVCRMAAVAGAKVVPVDIGIAGETSSPGILRMKVACGTRNFLKEPAMSRRETVQALETGIAVAGEMSRGHRKHHNQQRGAFSASGAAAQPCDRPGSRAGHNLLPQENFSDRGGNPPPPPG